MTDSMTLERFSDLADAYGGTIARWPRAEQAAAMHLAADPAALAALTRAIDFDAVLDAWVVETASPTLTARIIAGAPKPANQLTGLARLWWSGLGLAATLAGAAAGSLAAAAALPAPMAVDGSTVFGSLDRNDPS